MQSAGLSLALCSFTMTQHRRRRGRETEILVAEHLVNHGFASAHATSASAPGSDILGVAGVDFEVKGRKGFSPLAAIKQIRKRRKETGLGIVVMRLDGQGESSVGDFMAIMTFDDAIYLLKASGYGRSKD